jgi:hypothetical protein
MPIPSLQKQAIEIKMNSYCKNKIPQELQNQIKLSYKIWGNNITLIESRPFWEDSTEWIDMKVAQIRFDNQNKTFSLYYRDSNEKWHPYDELLISQNIEDILKEINNDPTGIFWS